MIASIQNLSVDQENSTEPEPCDVDAPALTEIIRSLAEKSRADYIYPGIAEQICIRLLKGLEDGEYVQVGEGEILAPLALTIHMQEVNHDEHLWVRWHPDPLPEHPPREQISPQGDTIAICLYFLSG